MRAPKQEAAYVVVNTPTEHIRFRYLHMNPHKLDEDGLFSGRVVREGEFIGEVSTFSRREGGTSYHLHFDVQVPTKYGWVFVNPYMTLIASYERLIAARGTEIKHPSERDKVAIGGKVPQTEAVNDPRCKSKRLSWRARRQLCGAGAERYAGEKRWHRVRKVGRHVSRKSRRAWYSRSDIRSYFWRHSTGY
jgi:hypothetical protein